MEQSPIPVEDLSLGFPKEYMQPMQTAIGAMYPPPKLRYLMDKMQNVQKRMELTKTMAHPVRLQKAYARKEDREEKLKQLQEDFNDQQKELESLQDQLKNTPIKPEHARHPTANISYCCKSLVHAIPDDELPENPKFFYRCDNCGREASVFRRIDKEDWKKEYAAMVMLRNAEIKEDRKKVESGEKRKQVIDKPRGYVPYSIDG